MSQVYQKEVVELVPELMVVVLPVQLMGSPHGRSAGYQFQKDIRCHLDEVQIHSQVLREWHSL